MGINVVLQIVTVLALVASLSFMGYYSRFKFEESPEGINQMVTAGAVSLLAAGYIVFRILEHGSGAWILVIAWGLIATVFVWRILRLRHLHKDNKQQVKEK